MTERSQIIGRWMVVDEDQTAGTMKLQAFGTDVPRRRGGYRNLELLSDGNVKVMRPGPADRLEPADNESGDWCLIDDETLEINAGAWTGQYRIEDVTKDRLKITRK